MGCLLGVRFGQMTHGHLGALGFLGGPPGRKNCRIDLSHEKSWWTWDPSWSLSGNCLASGRRSPGNWCCFDLSPLSWGREGKPLLKIDYREKKLVPIYSKLSTGEPSASSCCPRILGCACASLTQSSGYQIHMHPFEVSLVKNRWHRVGCSLCFFPV